MQGWIGWAQGRLQPPLLAAGLLVATLASCGRLAPPPPRPDVLLVLCDTLRADRTSVLSGDAALTPALAALGARGTVFRQAVSPASWTLPAMAAVFSGLDAMGNRHAARPDAAALAERFRTAGYTTIGISANPLLTADNGFARGFDTFVVAPAASVADLRANLHDLRAWDADALVARALAAAGAAARDRPLFVWLQLMDAHVPYDPAHDTSAPAEPGWSAPRPQPPRWDAWQAELSPEAAGLLSSWRRAYDGQVLALDGALGRLLDHWGEVRPGEPLVALTADHGEALFDHARNPDSPPGPGPLGTAYDEHGEQLYEEALRVPLVLAGPGVPVGHDESRAVTTRDLGATLLALCGLADAAPRLPLAAGDPVPEVLFGASTRGWYARRGDRQLVLPYPERAAAPGVEPLLLEVAAGDCLPQRDNLAAAEPDATRALSDALAAWLQRSGPAPEEPLDEATRVRLQQLGYVR
ncbi:MAG TPA: sulfatase-like hydrolase/transferase [Planctomycetota bacterium]|nr:sulfatase-like hydrolase/transferase [Planctomycetota bacterium]